MNTDTALNTPAVVFSQDAIQKFKMQSAISSTMYGFSANQVNIDSKSRGLRKCRCKPHRSLAVCATTQRAQGPADCLRQIRYLPLALATRPFTDVNRSRS
jgi:hypothetical protein